MVIYTESFCASLWITFSAWVILKCRRGLGSFCMQADLINRISFLDPKKSWNSPGLPHGVYYRELRFNMHWQIAKNDQSLIKTNERKKKRQNSRELKRIVMCNLYSLQFLAISIKKLFEIELNISCIFDNK